MNGIFMNGIQQCNAVVLTRNVNKHTKTNTVQAAAIHCVQRLGNVNTGS